MLSLLVHHDFAELRTHCPLPIPPLHLPPCRPDASLRDALLRHYVQARLALCRFACAHQSALGAMLAVELALCLACLAIFLARGGFSAGAEGQSRRSSSLPQFVVASAADPKWHATASELKRPLLG